ncbi:hypothetical protein BC936DRAFT_143587 [Jimgerdemannia flammicorona]|uniref:Tail specific protease domain-containing protein n=1 Tax=Jimgerdemannia flammicorona TaxID=994334 RepID=A0A433DDQ8_9FUNG|nr:hypothetical protein BC936DRAFT_143587 [Jimgerdemannia flammicorona]
MKISLALTLAIATLFGTSFSAPATTMDVCGSVGNVPETWVTWKRAMACIRSIPFNTKSRDEVLNHIEKTLPFYVFLDQARNYTGRYPSQVDLLAGIQRIRKTTYPDDYSFNVDIENLFTSLNDGHTIFLNYCYTSSRKGQWDFRAPFPISPISVGDKLKWYVVNADIGDLATSSSETYLESFKAQTGINATRYAGAEVTAINGLPVLEVVKKFADTQIGVSRDPSTRFNIAVATGRTQYPLGAFSYRQSIRKPDSATLSYTLIPAGETKAKTLTVPWMALTPSGSFASAAEYYKSNCVYSTSASVAAVTEKQRTPVLRAREFEQDGGLEKWALVNATVKGTTAPAGVLKPQNPSCSGDFEVPTLAWVPWGCFYKLDKKTAVFTLSEFQRTPHSKDGAWQKQFKSAFQILEQQNLTKLVVDFSDNHGGSIAFAYALLNYLFPAQPPHLYFTTDIRLHPLALKLTAAAVQQNNTDSFWHYSSWADPTTGAPFTNPNQFPGHITYTRGGVATQYTARFIDNVANDFALLPPSTNFHYAPSDVLFLSNGNSFSAGALVARHLQDVVGVKTAVLGGYPDQPQAAWTTIGGQVYTIDSDITDLGLDNDPDAPPATNLRISVTFAIREAYGNDQPAKKGVVPLEFSWKAADYKIPFTAENVLRPAVYWKQAAALLA